MILNAFKFNPLSDDQKPNKDIEVLIFLNDKWLGHDEIITAAFDGKDFYHKGRKVHDPFIKGWLELPIKLAYDSSKELFA